MVGKIYGTGSYIPKNAWNNDKLAQMVDTSDEWIRERTGIETRNIADESESTASMAAEAARLALADAKIAPEDVDLIITATVSGGMLAPCTACRVQSILGAVNATCFDMNAACTGFLFAMNTAQSYISQGIYKTAVVIGAEKLSDLINWNDRSTCILFADGAGAAVIKGSCDGKYSQVTHSAGDKGDALRCASRNQKRYENIGAEETFIQMEGSDIFKFAVSRVPKVINELLIKEGLEVKNIDLFVVHQANARIVTSIAKKLGIPSEKIPINIRHTGNTSSASIPILLDELNKKGALHRGDSVVLAGFGGGLSYGASLIRW